MTRARTSLTRTGRGLALGLLGAVTVLGSVAAPEAPAQTSTGKQQTLSPPTPAGGKNEGGNWAQFFTALLIATAIIGVNFIPSKRGHQD